MCVVGWLDVVRDRKGKVMKKQTKISIVLVSCILMSSINDLRVLLPLTILLFVFIEIAFKKEMKAIRKMLLEKLDDLLFEEA